MAGGGGYVDPIKRQSVQSPFIPKGTVVNSSSTGTYQAGGNYGGGGGGGGSSQPISVPISVPSPTEQVIQNKVNTQLKYQSDYFQNLVNSGKMSVAEANQKLNKVLEVYQDDLYARNANKIMVEKSLRLGNLSRREQFNQAVAEQKYYKENYGTSELSNTEKRLRAVGVSSSSGNLKNLRYFPKSLISNPIIRSARLIPTVMKDYALSLAKGTVKFGLYAKDESGYIQAMKVNLRTGKLYIPPGTKAISDSPRFNKNVKKWANYDFKTNPFKDPDYQNVGVTAALMLLGIKSPSIAKKVFGLIKGKAVWDAIKEPTEYNIAVAESMFLPELSGKIKKLKSRGDILLADTGELVPLKERIKQVDYLVKNSGKKVETITAKPSKKAGFTNIKNKGNVDYTYGNKVEFGTYKVGKAYPTSEYFLKGKGKKIQQILKTGRVNIEKVDVGKVNRKYGREIKSQLLKKGKVSESLIKKYYSEAKIEANIRGKPIAVISPKRLRGFYQAEQELIKIIPDKYQPKKLKFAGFTESGHKVYTDQGYIKNIKSFVNSKINQRKIEVGYWEEIAKDKYKYIKGRPAMRGEYSEHGIEHLTGGNLDSIARKYVKKSKSFRYHDITKVSDVESFSAKKFEHGKTAADLIRKGKFPDKSIYKLSKKIQKQIADAYEGHTHSKTRITSILKKIGSGKLREDLKWYLKQKRNPYLQDTLTLDRIDLARGGRWNNKINYKLLSKDSLKRIYGSEKNAIKNIKFLDWKTVPKRLRESIGKRKINDIIKRDNKVLKNIRIESKKFKIPGGKITPYKKSIRKEIYPANRINTYRGLNVHYTKRGQPYVRTIYGAKFISYKGKNKPYISKSYIGKKPIYSNKNYPKKYSPQYKKPKYQPSNIKYNKENYPKKYSPQYKKPKYQPPSYPPRKNITTFNHGKKLIVGSRIKKKYEPKTKIGYRVWGKSGNKFIKLNKKPLSKQDALSRGKYAIDNTTSKTLKIVPIGRVKKFGSISSTERGYNDKVKKKFRTYKIIRGRGHALNNTYIEKRKYGIDTLGEKRQLSLARFAKQRGFLKDKNKINKPARKNRSSGILTIKHSRILSTPRRNNRKIIQKKTSRNLHKNRSVKKIIRRRNGGIFSGF